MQVFAAFAVIRKGSDVWATTRDGKDVGRIGLPGGKCDPGEHPCDTAKREAFEEGLAVSGEGALIHSDMVEGRLVQWFAFNDASPLDTYKEQARGIKPVLAPVATIASSGYGNEFLGV